MLKAFNFIVIRPPKLHIIMYSSFPTFLDCGSDIMWRHYEIMIAEFLTEPTGEPTGNRKLERIHSVNSIFSVWIEDLRNPWRNCQRLIDPVLYSLKVMILNKREFSFFKRMAVADPGERSGSPPYFWTKLRPEGPNKNFFKTAPSPLY